MMESGVGVDLVEKEGWEKEMMWERRSEMHHVSGR